MQTQPGIFNNYYYSNYKLMEQTVLKKNQTIVLGNPKDNKGQCTKNFMFMLQLSYFK